MNSIVSFLSVVVWFNSYVMVVVNNRFVGVNGEGNSGIGVVEVVGGR